MYSHTSEESPNIHWSGVMIVENIREMQLKEIHT